MTASRLTHDALFYRDAGEYAAGVGGFVREGLDAGEPVLVAVPRERHELLDDGSGRVRFEDMRVLGANPWRIIPAVRSWADAQGERRVRFVGEPIWLGRSAAATAEATRHESLINLAFFDCDAAILCPYDAGLDAAILADAEHTHPTILGSDGERVASPAYTGVELAFARGRLTEPPANAAVIPITEDLAALRREMREVAAAAGASEELVDDLMLAGTEAAANTLAHAPTPGTASLWTDDGQLICDVRSPGQIADPLAGRRPPGDDLTGGRGIWLINQICDLVELRLGPPEAVLRLHLQLH